MNHIRLFVREVFQFNQRDFWLLISGNILFGLSFRYFDVHPFIQTIIILFMLFKSFTFLKATSVMPSVSSDFDRFSWKYFQGLPLNKKELIISLVIGNMLSMTPLIVLALSFATQFGDFFQDSSESMAFSTKSKLFLVVLHLLVYFSFSSLKNLVTLPRRQYSRIDSKIVFYQVVRNIIIFSVLVTYGLWFLIFLSEATGINFGDYLVKSLKFSWSIVISWWIVPISVLVVVYAYSETLKTFQTEKKGYIRPSWNTNRDLSIIAICISLNIFFFHQMNIYMPERYSGNEFTEKVFENDYKTIAKLISQKVDINKANQHGYTPLMVAAAEGNYSMFKYLLSSGSNLKGYVKSIPKGYYNGMNILSLSVVGGNYSIVQHLLNDNLDVNHVTSEDGNSPLHLASSSCRTKIADLLIEKKAYLNSVNKKGESPLHLASKSKCFGTVVSLIEAGTNPLIKDKKGLIAREHLKNYREDLSYYLDKKSRAPAGK